MPLQPAHCTTCARRLWRTVTHPKTGDALPLWPAAEAVFAVVRTPLGQLAPGIAYCAAHAPLVGDDGPDDLTIEGAPVGPTTVVLLQSARERHARCYTGRYGAWLEAWLRELAVEHKLAESEFAPVLAQWREDMLAQEASIHGSR